MRVFLFAFLGGMLASIPAANMFANAGIGMMDNAGGMAMVNRMDLVEIIQFYTVLLLIPPIGSAIGAKLGGRGAEVHYMIGRGIGGQFIAFILLTIAFNQFPGFEASISALSPTGETIASLALLQIGCTLGTVWGI